MARSEKYLVPLFTIAFAICISTVAVGCGGGDVECATACSEPDDPAESVGQILVDTLRDIDLPFFNQSKEDQLDEAQDAIDSDSEGSESEGD
ncbi:MAG: hypothetical protein NPIRA03_37070 [Nitrospirales bacterium]|nr:MAG: hypothetical protein NPIRA03_37070 [Nitrospirales bacterium]